MPTELAKNDAGEPYFDNGLPVVVGESGEKAGFDIPGALGTIKRLSEERDGFRTRFEGSESNLTAANSTLEGLGDLEQVRKALKLADGLEDGELIKAEQLAERLVEVETKTKHEASAALDTLKSANQVLRDSVINSRRSAIFTDHPFAASLQEAIRGSNTLQSLFGGQWRVEDATEGNGVDPKLVPHGWDGKPLMSLIVKNTGHVADDTEALELLVRSHPSASNFLLSAKGGGVDSEGGDGGGGGGGDKFTVKAGWIRAHNNEYRVLKEEAAKAGRTVTVIP